MQPAGFGGIVAGIEGSWLHGTLMARKQNSECCLASILLLSSLAFPPHPASHPGMMASAFGVGLPYLSYLT